MQEAKEYLEYEGRECFFCSVGCQAEFQRHAEDYSTRSKNSGARENV